MLASNIIGSVNSNSDKYWYLLLEIHSLKEALKQLESHPQHQELLEAANLTGRNELAKQYLEDLEQKASELYTEKARG